MTPFKILAICFLIFGCSTTELVENWKNPDIEQYNPNKVLLVGMTANLDARQQFEQQLQEEYKVRGIEAVMSSTYFEPTFTASKKTEEELLALEGQLIMDGFDTILFTKVIGVEDNIIYKSNYDGYDSTYRKFSEDYLMYQDAYYNPDYYEDYTVYHTETAMYCICPTKGRSLIWKGYIDIMDPETISETVNDYVRLMVVVLDEQQLINSELVMPQIHEEAIK